jgi:hypothetical protein
MSESIHCLDALAYVLFGAIVIPIIAFIIAVIVVKFKK